MRRISSRVLAFGAVMLLALSFQAAADNSAATAQLDRLEAGVRAEEAIRAVKRLQYTYGHYLDSGLWADVGDLFTDDAVATFQSGAVTGKSAISKHFRDEAGRKAAGLGKGQLYLHLLLQPIITLSADGKTAKGAWHQVAMFGQYGKSASWAGGVYENEYVLDNGTWKISSIHLYPQYAGAYEEYGHKAPARWDIPYHFEAKHVGVTIPDAAWQVPSSGSANAARLAQRVRRLNDELAVQNLQHSLGYYVDRKLWDDVADLFADDGTYETGQRGVYVGREHIRRALEVFNGPGPLKNGELTDHINLGTVVTVAADGLSAGARTNVLAQLGRNGEWARWEQGTYENEFVKQGGVWKLEAVRYFPRLSSDYDKGWANDAKPAPVASKEFPPDRKPTQSYRSYPELSYVAFHYANPVTGKPVRYGSGAVTRVSLVKDSKQAAGGNADVNLAEVARNLDSAIGYDAVENLMSSYGYYIDESAWDNMADTYGSTGSKEITGAGVYVGPDRIRKVLNLRGPRNGRSANFYTIHQLLQPVIHISEDGKSARARVRLFQMGGAADGTSASWIGGIYENTAIKENGEWKFGVQELYHAFNASYRNGWARVGPVARALAGQGKPGREAVGGGITQGLGGAAGGPKVATDMPPDYPIRVRQYAFPEIVEPPFHYKNPVSGRTPPELLPPLS
ncbi:MAG: nuclear transport factor 2 family protein [Gammaproteobacteria bacterium]